MTITFKDHYQQVLYENLFSQARNAKTAADQAALGEAQLVYARQGSVEKVYCPTNPGGSDTATNGPTSAVRAAVYVAARRSQLEGNTNWVGYISRGLYALAAGVTTGHSVSNAFAGAPTAAAAAASDF